MMFQTASSPAREARPTKGAWEPRERRTRRGRGPIRELGMVLGRSLFPICAVVLIGGTVFFGPWFTLVGTFVWWRIVAAIA